MHWAEWSALDWVRHYGGEIPDHAAGLAIPTQVLAYRAMWDPFVREVAAACRACANGLEAADRSGDGSAIGTPYPRESWKGLAGVQRSQGDGLLAMWNKQQDWQVVVHPTAMLQDAQHVVMNMASSFLQNMRHVCPKLQVTVAAPSSALQAQVIAQAEAAKVVPTGLLQIAGMTGRGVLAVPGAVSKTVQDELARERSYLDKGLDILKSPFPWVAVGILGLVVLKKT